MSKGGLAIWAGVAAIIFLVLLALIALFEALSRRYRRRP